jgi:oxygen-dependent protoporphyrinogen oxidase
VERALTAVARDAEAGSAPTPRAIRFLDATRARPRIVVVGGGISGLAAAHRIVERAGPAGVEVSLLEASPRLGGIIDTERVGDFLVEGGPDSFVTDKPEAEALVRRLGLDADLIGTNAAFRRTLLVRDGGLETLPEAFQLLAPARLVPFLRSPILSWRGKLGALWDLVAPRGGPPPGGDESLASFVRRRLGQEVLERIAQPMVGGIYTADPETLSLAATMPRFLELERRHRSLILGLKREGRARELGTSGARFGLFATLGRGLGSLVDTLAERLPAGAIRSGARAVSIERLAADGDRLARSADSRWRIALADGERIDATAVIVALPAPRAAELLSDVDRELARELGAIDYASSAIVSMAFRRADVPRALDAFGVVVPEIERRRIIACSFSSVKFERRAPTDAVLLRAFVGGALHPEVCALDDGAIAAAVREELRALFGIVVEPTFTRLRRWPESMPQYRVGHGERVERIRARADTLDMLALAGNAYAGVGLPDCIRSGESAADAILDRLQALATRSTLAGGTP